MKRQEIEQDYDVKNGVIHSPGKFEGEAVYVPFYWDAYLNGGADEDLDSYLIFNVTNEDRAQFPELAGVQTVKLYEREDGFVCEA